MIRPGLDKASHPFRAAIAFRPLTLAVIPCVYPAKQPCGYSGSRNGFASSGSHFAPTPAKIRRVTTPSRRLRRTGMALEISIVMGVQPHPDPSSRRLAPSCQVFSAAALAPWLRSPSSSLPAAQTSSSRPPPAPRAVRHHRHHRQHRQYYDGLCPTSVTAPPAATAVSGFIVSSGTLDRPPPVHLTTLGIVPQSMVVTPANDTFLYVASSPAARQPEAIYGFSDRSPAAPSPSSTAALRLAV